VRSEDRRAAVDAADQWHAAVDAAGQAVMAVLCGEPIQEIGIAWSDAHSTWEGFISYRASSSAERLARIGLAGEAALLLQHLEGERTVSVWGEHRGLAERLREWDAYWRGFGVEAMVAGLTGGDNLDLNVQDAEIAALLALFRCQAYRLLRQDANQTALEALAERLREVKSLSGAEADRLLRAWMRGSAGGRADDKERTMNESVVAGGQAQGEGVTAEGSEFFCPDLFGDWRNHRRGDILRYTLEVPMDNLESVYAWLRERVLEQEPADSDSSGAGDALDELPEDDDIEDERSLEREWLGDFNDLEDTATVEVEVPVRRAWILDGFLAERPKIGVRVEEIAREEEED
jgi:hypothetical protein